MDAYSWSILKTDYSNFPQQTKIKLIHVQRLTSRIQPISDRAIFLIKCARVNKSLEPQNCFTFGHFQIYLSLKLCFSKNDTNFTKKLSIYN